MADILPPKGGSPERLPNGQYAPGRAPGRPKGAKGKAATRIRKMIEKIFDEETADGETTKLEKALQVQMNAAMGGDLAALTVLLSYSAGRPRMAEADATGDAMSALTELVQERMARSDKNSFRPEADIELEPERNDDDDKED